MDVEIETQRRCVDVMKLSKMFYACSEETKNLMCSKMSIDTLSKNDILYRQDQQQSDMALIATGRFQRNRVIQGQPHLLTSSNPGDTIGAHHVLCKDRSGDTSKCLSETATIFRLSSLDYSELLNTPTFSRDIIYTLNREVRRQMKLLQAPLFSQRPKPTPIAAISIAAALESFYRSALNATLNAKLVGGPVQSLFPNMAVQVPARVAYINGFKGIRHFLDEYMESENTSMITRLGVAVAPGVIMTPISSMLEACNAGHMNVEPLQTRWIRGFVPRTFREIIFGVGLNQLSDYIEERVVFIESAILKNATASVVAGTIAGYLSHIPHNLSTLKLMIPEKSYPQHIQDLIMRSEKRVPQYLTPTTRYYSAAALAFLFPRGLGIRTTQIVGSFIILNGTINSLKDFDIRDVAKGILKD